MEALEKGYELVENTQEPIWPGGLSWLPPTQQTRSPACLLPRLPLLCLGGTWAGPGAGGDPEAPTLPLQATVHAPWAQEGNKSALPVGGPAAQGEPASAAQGQRAPSYRRLHELCV